MSVTQLCVEKIYVNFNAPAAFNLRQKILGDQNANLQYIINETQANVSLRGRGSGFIESGPESNEPMHLYIEHLVAKSLIEAKNLSKNLLDTVQQELQTFMQTNQTTQAMSIQQPPPIIQTTNNQTMTIPSAILSVPPPNIIQNNAIQSTHIIQPSNFINQSHIIPQSMQIIQQTPINIPPPPAVSIPTIRATTTTPISVQFQGQPNIQIQPTAQPFIVNQTPSQQYQLQYIPANPINNNSQAQTIQHFIQPQQQLQGLIQPNTQQFITVQGAYMLPPPNLIHNPQSLGAIFNPPPTIHLNPEDMTKIEGLKTKMEECKTGGNSHQMITNSRNIINQPPPSIQQFLVNANAWPQNQIQQMPIQIVAQPQTLRSGNEILIQNAAPAGQTQQVLTFTNQPGTSLQQIQFNQSIINQPPPSKIQVQNAETQQSSAQSTVTDNIRQNLQKSNYQQHFEQKINLMADNQRRTLKRKVDEFEDKSFPKIGVGLMAKIRPPLPIQQNQEMVKATANNSRMLAKSNVNTSSTIADNISIINSKNSNNKIIFTKNNSTSSVAMKPNISQAEQTQTSSGTNTKNDKEFIDMPTTSTATSHLNFEIHNQFMQPPPNIQFSQVRNVPPQIMMYQTQIPPPQVQQQQDLNVLQNSSTNFIQQLNINRLNVPRGMILQMNPINDNSGNATFSQGQPRFKPQW